MLSKAVRPYLRFRVGSLSYGIPIENVVEVLEFMFLTELPNAAPNILGMMTLGERVVPVMDLRRYFGVKDISLTSHTPIIVVKADNAFSGLVVDSVDDLERVDLGQIIPQEAEFSPDITSIARLNNGLLLLLDVSRIVHKKELR